MKNRKLINEVRQLKKIAGLLKEEDYNFNDTANDWNKNRRLEIIEDIIYGLDEGESPANLIGLIEKVYPEYVERIKEYNKLEEEIYNRAFNEWNQKY